tara:strand:- start:14 stop:148 length:135 start_codon:yes stop_codon:yes gene_type:complete
MVVPSIRGKKKNIRKGLGGNVLFRFLLISSKKKEELFKAPPKSA